MKTWEGEIAAISCLHGEDCCRLMGDDNHEEETMDCCENMRIIRTKIEEAEKRGEERERERNQSKVNYLASLRVVTSPLIKKGTILVNSEEFNNL